jgi:hypothetical protein
VQASQIAAAARWLKPSGSSVQILAIGPRTSLMALTAAALEPEAISGLEVRQPLSSLKEIVQTNKVVNDAPEYFCFGLLEQFDLPHLTAMVAPREVKVVGSK